MKVIGAAALITPLWLLEFMRDVTLTRLSPPNQAERWLSEAAINAAS